VPARNRRADGNARVASGQGGEFICVGTADDDVAHAAALEAIGQIVRSEHGARRNHHGAEFERRQHGLPEGQLVAEHD